MTDHKRTYSQRGDDYLLEAQKVCEKEKPAPRCLLCGEEMHLGYAFTSNIVEGHKRKWRYYCKCGLWFPLMDTPEEALFIAQKRWQEPNRVLTLEEVKEQRTVWLEKVDFYPVPAIFYSYRYPHHSVFGGKFEGRDDFDDNNLYDNEDYRVAWRCWLRKPSAEEMSTTPWREK